MGAVYSCSSGGGAVLLQAITNGDDTTFRKVCCSVCSRLRPWPGSSGIALVCLARKIRLSGRPCIVD